MPRLSHVPLLANYYPVGIRFWNYISQAESPRPQIGFVIWYAYLPSINVDNVFPLTYVRESPQ